MGGPCRWLVLVVALTMAVACSRTDLAAVLTDFRWGLAEACTQEWVKPQECQIGDDAFVAALVITQNSPAAEVKPAIAKVLQDVLEALPADSHLRPYLSTVLPFLT